MTTADNDPFLIAARALLDAILGDMSAALAGLSPHALDWRPPAPEANSLAVLAVHALHSTHSWLAVATGAPLPPREREAEFLATAARVDLPALVASVGDDCRALLQPASPVDWAWGIRPTQPRAWALLHAVEHLREHVAQMALTRQLWEREQGGD